jgi:U3 small nucleolar RNA-associated protein 19
MPATVGKSGQSAKRKRVSSEKKPSKRVRSESPEESDDDDQAQILLLETEIFKSKTNYNNIVKLIKILRSDSEDGDAAVLAAISLCRVFTRLMVSGEMTLSKQGTTEKEAVVIKWLKERYAEYKAGLIEFLEEEEIAPTILTLCMRLLKTEGQHLRGGQEFPVKFLTDIVQIMLKPTSDGGIRKEFSEKFVEEYDDIRFYTFEAIE